MNFPTGATAIVRALYDQHLQLAQGSEEQRRELTKMIVQTMLVRIGPGWGLKRADPTRPLSKDSLAFNLGAGAFASWDWQNGTTKAIQIEDGKAPTYPRITDQIFVPVDPFDWLEPVAIEEPPPPPPPPPRDEQLERLIVVVQAATVALEMMTRALHVVSDRLLEIKATGVRVHL